VGAAGPRRAMTRRERCDLARLGGLARDPKKKFVGSSAGASLMQVNGDHQCWLFPIIAKAIPDMRVATRRSYQGARASDRIPPRSSGSRPLDCFHILAGPKRAHERTGTCHCSCESQPARRSAEMLMPYPDPESDIVGSRP